MAEITFIYEGKSKLIHCNMNQTMNDICTNFSNEINVDINSLIFLYGGKVLKLEKNLNEITKENKITILAFKIEDEIYSKSEIKLADKNINEILLLNNNINKTLIEINNQIGNIINNIMKNDNNWIITQLQNIQNLINKMNEDNKKLNSQLNIIKYNDVKNNTMIKINENKELKSLNNEISCVYNKQEDEISLLHDYSDLNFESEEEEEFYEEGKINLILVET